MSLAPSSTGQGNRNDSEWTFAAVASSIRRRRARDMDLSVHLSARNSWFVILARVLCESLKGLNSLSTHHLNPPVRYVSSFYTVSPPLQFVAKNPFAKGWITLLGGG